MTLPPLETTTGDLKGYFLLIFGLAFCGIAIVFLFFAVSIVRSVRRSRQESADGIAVDQLATITAQQQATSDSGAGPEPSKADDGQSTDPIERP